MGCPKHGRFGVCYKLKVDLESSLLEPCLLRTWSPAMCAGTTSKCLPQLDWAILLSFWSGHIQLTIFGSMRFMCFNLWNFTNIWQFWLQWYFWNLETRIGLDSLHSGPKRFARHRIWTFLTLILIPLAIFSISHIFYHLTNTWWKTSRALQPNSFWCFKTKNPSPGISTSLQCQCLRLRTCNSLQV